MNRILPLAIVGAVLAALGGYLFYDRAQPACEGIYQQSAVRLGGQIKAISTEGGLFMGRAQIQELSEGAQKVGQHLRTCCTVLDAGRISAEQFQSCMAGASQYEARLAQVVSAVEEISSARGAGDSALAERKTEQLGQLADQAAQGVADFTRQVTQITASSAGNATDASGTAVEPNDTPTQATPVQADTATAGEIVADDKDYYRFHHAGAVRDRVEIRLENRSTGLVPQMTVFDAAKSQLLNAYDSTAGADLGRQLTMEADADYYVQVQPFVASSGGYVLTVRPLHVADAHEPNDDVFSATALAAGEVAQGSILDRQDADWFRFTGIPAGKHRLRLDNGSATLIPDVTLYNADKQQHAHEYQTTPGANVSVEFEADSAQDWLVRVAPFSDSEGAYQLTVQ